MKNQFKDDWPNVIDPSPAAIHGSGSGLTNGFDGG